MVGAAADEATLRVRPAPPGVSSVADFGPQEDIAPATLFDLGEVLPELKRADIMRAGKRAAAAASAPAGDAAPPPPPPPPLFYDWELAVPPEYNAPVFYIHPLVKRRMGECYCSGVARKAMTLRHIFPH